MPRYFKVPELQGIYKDIIDNFPKSAVGVYLKQFIIPNKRLVLLELKKIISGQESLYNSRVHIEIAKRYEDALNTTIR